jgi:L-fuconolactonase
MTQEQHALRHDFLPEALYPLLQEQGFDGSVAVQGRETVTETEWLLLLADEYPFIQAVVGWVDLCAPDVERDLDRFTAHPKFKGARMVIHDRSDEDFAALPEYRRGVTLLGTYGLTYDLLLKPPHLDSATRLVDSLPSQKFVVDHSAKPEIHQGRFAPWRAGITEIAKRPNVYCKVSGLITEADWENWRPRDIFPYLDVVAEAFGIERLMIGSDWPVCLCAGYYRDAISVVRDWSNRLSTSEQADIFGLTCARFYDIDTSA